MSSNFYPGSCNEKTCYEYMHNTDNTTKAILSQFFISVAYVSQVTKYLPFIFLKIVDVLSVVPFMLDLEAQLSNTSIKARTTKNYKSNSILCYTQSIPYRIFCNINSSSTWTVAPVPSTTTIRKGVENEHAAPAPRSASVLGGNMFAHTSETDLATAWLKSKMMRPPEFPAIQKDTIEQSVRYKSVCSDRSIMRPPFASAMKTRMLRSTPGQCKRHMCKNWHMVEIKTQTQSKLDSSQRVISGSCVQRLKFCKANQYSKTKTLCSNVAQLSSLTMISKWHSRAGLLTKEAWNA